MKEKRVNSDIEILEGRQGKIVKQRVKAARNAEQVAKIKSIMQFCYRSGVHVPRVLRTEGTFLFTHFVEGEGYNGSVAQLKNLARELALLHQCLVVCQIAYNYDPSRQSYIIPGWKPRRDQLVHHDMHPGNVLFRGDKVAAILDFGGIRKGEVLEDVAFAAFRFGGASRKNIEIFLESYRAYSGIKEVDFRTAKEYFVYETLRRINSLKTSRVWFKRPEKRAKELRKQRGFLKQAKKL